MEKVWIKPKKAKGVRGRCSICSKWVEKGQYYVTSGTDGHGADTDLAHQHCYLNK